MPRGCAVPCCKNAIGGHVFPLDISLKKKWIVAIKRENVGHKPWIPGPNHVVCFEHFIEEDYVEEKPFG